MRLFTSLNIFVFLLIFSLPGTAQDCDCDGSGNCPSSFGPNFTGQVCYDITDALNNSLASPTQGICGVSITFTHQHIWDLELSLISPAGQVVPLVGVNTNFFGTTNNVLWNILFIPCNNIPLPDPPYAAVWTNAQSWPFAAFIEGSYHPVGGNCLEAFNTGPVNGTWCLQIDNQPSPYSGEILNFEVILCDNSGLLCCDADAGEIDVADFSICEGDGSLLLDWDPDYGFIEPDPAEYGYFWVVSDSSGVILQVDTLPDLTTYSSGNYSVCGLSYLLSDSAGIPSPNGAITIGDLWNNLNGPSPWFCGELTDDCVEIQIVPPPPAVFLTDTICLGESYMVGDSLVDEAGYYVITLENALQCDSTVELDLTVLHPDSVFLTETLCFGENFAVGDSLYAASGNYTTVLVNDSGCDSLVFLDLTVLPEIEVLLTDTICQGDVYAVGDSLFDAAGTYAVPLQSYIGCDSLVTLNLTVLDPLAVIAAPDTITCNEPAVWLDATSSTSGAGVHYQWTALTGELAPPAGSNQVLALSPGLFELEVSLFFCSVKDSVEVFADTLAPIAQIAIPDTLTCLADSVLLDGSGSSSGPGFSYEWLTVPGAATPAIWAFSGGAYSLVVLDQTNGCADTATVLVEEDLQPPFADAGPDAVINCQFAVVTLDGSATYQDGAYAFEWLGPGGISLPWTDSLQAEVVFPGTYVLLATDLYNGCSAQDSMVVVQDTILPIAEAGLPDTITCFEPQLTLSGLGSSQSGQLDFSWATPDGNIVSGANTANPLVDAPGLYILTLTDPVNFCQHTDTVEIAEDVAYPAADAGPMVTLNCLLTSWNLGNPDQTSVGPQYSYFWIGPSGDTISTELSPEIHAGGTYYLYVTDQTNGCITTDSVLIEEEGDFPVAILGPGGSLTCSNPTVLLDGSASTASPFIEYLWLDPQGNVIGQSNQLTVGNAGEYCLLVVDGFNFCTDTACAEVLQGPGFPLVDAGPNEALDCTSGQAFLQATVEPLNPGTALAWSTVSGNILSGTDQLAILVDEPGWYVLTVDDTVNDCMVIDSAFVLLDTAACLPLINAGADGLINCYNVPFDTLDASQGTAVGFNIEYQWTSIGGTVFSGENTLTPVVTEGTFILAVTNTTLGITATDTVVVFEDLVFPIAEAGPPELVLDCSTISDSFYLDGAGSSLGSEFVYEWSTSGGFIVSGADSLHPLISAPGLYDLQVTNFLNGCSSTDAILITLDGEIPEPCVPVSEQIPCGEATFVTGDTCFFSNTYTYQWQVTGGNLLSDPTQALIEIEWIDSVVVVSGFVIDTTNSCPAVVNFQFFSPTACFPDCEIALPDTLTCDVTSITLDGGGSSVGPEFLYSWSAVSGSFCGGETTLFPCVDAPGLYRLTVTDTTTQFTCTQDVVVLENVTPPPVDAGPVQFLTCEAGEVALQGVPQSGLSYQWTAEPGAGCILSGEQTPNPVVACAGNYFLETTSLSNGCTATDTVAVMYDTIPPAAAIQIGDTLTCAVTSVLITSQGSSAGPDITYRWTLDGSLLATGLGSWQAIVPGIYCLEVIDENTGCSSQDCDTLVQITTVPFVSAGQDTLLTCGVTEVELLGTNGGGPGLTAEWSTLNGCIQSDPFQADVLIACPGLYTFHVTDISTGCTAIDTVEVLSDTIPPEAIILPADPITCTQPEVVMDGSASIPAGILSYQWYTPFGVVVGPADQPVAIAGDAGVYQLIVQNTINQCADTAFLLVDSEVILPTANGGPDNSLTCFSPQALLDGSGSSSGPEYVYQWSPAPLSGANTLFPQIGAPGVYVLTVTDTTNFCVSTDTVVVTADNLPPEAVIDLAGQQPVITCDQESIALSGELSQPSGQLDYQWGTIGGQLQGDLQASQVNALAGGSYWLIVQNQQNGCLDTAMLVIGANLQPPVIEFVLPDTLDCVVSAVQLDASSSSGTGPLEALWTGPGTIDGSATLIPVVYQPGVYQLLLTDSANGCSSQDSLIVLRDTIPPLAVAAALGIFGCEAVSVGLSGAGSSAGTGFSYLWTGPSGSQISSPEVLSPTVFAPGWYVLTVTNLQNGCMASDSVEVLSEGAPITGLDIGLVLPSCFGDRDGIISVDSVWGGTGPFLYDFDDNGFYAYTRFQYLEAGEYFLVVKDDNGCMFDTLIVLPNPNELTVDAGPDQYIELGETVLIEAIPNKDPAELSWISWQPYGDPVCGDCLAFEAIPPYTTTFVISVKDLNGCLATDNMTVFVEKSSPVFFPTAFSPNGDGENDYFFGQSGRDVSRIDLLQVFDRWGNLVFEAINIPPNDPSYGWDGSMNGRPLNSQVYVWHCRLSLQDGTTQRLKGDILLAR